MPSGGVSIRVISGLTSSGQPLYIVDGNRVTIDPARGIDWLQPEDILRITVLKDAAETAVYGPSGSSGVVVITTKRSMRRMK
jgi:TonB-dependent SusC/RagA subfamily outer membrane receptor